MEIANSILSEYNIFDKLFGMSPNRWPDKNRYYHCIRADGETKYTCKIVTGEHRIIPVYPDVPKTMDRQVLEGVLKVPVNM